MKVVLTGAAGFIGSRVAELLVDHGHSVLAVDCFLDDLYPAATKRERARRLQLRGVETLDLDMRLGLAPQVLDGADVVINEAAIPGLERSWSDLGLYVDCNVRTVANLLSSSTIVGGVPIVHASTSSVYGLTAETDESGELAPVSPYGATKLSAEELIRAYARTHDQPFTILRYFSVYGPDQRSDMAYYRVCEALLDNCPITVLGDGMQVRSNTFVGDVARATVSAALGPASGQVYNVCGTEARTLLDAVELLAGVLNVKPRLDFKPPRAGDQLSTRGDASKARADLGFVPQVRLEEGLRLQAAWHLGRRHGTARGL